MGNGMKSGSGEDPFADVAAGDDAEQTENSEDDVEDRADNEADTGGAAASSDSSYPWLFTRNNAKDGREMVQFFLQQETQALESRAQTDLEGMLGEEPLVLDIREAAYQVALEQHLDDVVAELREWGYDTE